MELDAMLCNHAEAAEGKLYVNGAGINLLFVQPEPPHVVTFAVGAIVTVPYTATNQAHKIAVRIEDADGHTVEPWVPEGMQNPGPIRIEAGFNVGRPPVLEAGEAQFLPFAFGLQGVPMPHVGSYSAVVEIDGTEMRRLSFRVLVPTP